jgi:two-component system chemotaxis response regulator CheB
VRRNLVVIGASAGGVEALRDLVGKLPRDFSASVIVVLHVPPYGGSVLPAILNRAGELPARHPISGERLPEGSILVAPPDHHVIVDGDRVVLTRGPRENGHRPAVDVLFRSAARSAGPRAIGVVLSGVLDDGTSGLMAIASRGGAAIAQDPGDALYPNMPINAARHVEGTHVLPAAEIAELLVQLTAEDVDDVGPAPHLMEYETEIAMMDEDAINGSERPGVPSGFSCPDCKGTLWEIQDGNLVRYRCRVGHAWSSESLLGEQSEQLDGALWMALRGLEEKAALARELGDRADERGSALSAERFREQATEASRAARLIRSMLEAHVGSPQASELGA